MLFDTLKFLCAFKINELYACAIPIPICWIVVIEGVGAIYELPKNRLVVVVFSVSELVSNYCLLQ